MKNLPLKAVLMAIVLAHFIYKNDKLTFPRVAGCILGFAGVVIACFAGVGYNPFGNFS